MEEKENGLFRQSALDRISSPEQLDDYIRVEKPSVWIIIAAIVILLAAFLVWGAFGTLPTTVPVVCSAESGILTCYVADASDLRAGMQVTLPGNGTGHIQSISSVPYSSEEISKRYASDYTLHMLGIGDWNYEVKIAAPDAADGLTEGTVITDRVHPITFIFN